MLCTAHTNTHTHTKTYTQHKNTTNKWHNNVADWCGSRARAYIRPSGSPVCVCVYKVNDLHLCSLCMLCWSVRTNMEYSHTRIFMTARAQERRFRNTAQHTDTPLSYKVSRPKRPTPPPPPPPLPVLMLLCVVNKLICWWLINYKSLIRPVAVVLLTLRGITFRSRAHTRQHCVLLMGKRCCVSQSARNWTNTKNWPRIHTHALTLWWRAMQYLTRAQIRDHANIVAARETRASQLIRSTSRLALLPPPTRNPPPPSAGLLSYLCLWFIVSAWIDPPRQTARSHHAHIFLNIMMVFVHTMMRSNTHTHTHTNMPPPRAARDRKQYKKKQIKTGRIRFRVDAFLAYFVWRRSQCHNINMDRGVVNSYLKHVN